MEMREVRVHFRMLLSSLGPGRSAFCPSSLTILPSDGQSVSVLGGQSHSHGLASRSMMKRNRSMLQSRRLLGARKPQSPLVQGPSGAGTCEIWLLAPCQQQMLGNKCFIETWCQGDIYANTHICSLIWLSTLPSVKSSLAHGGCWQSHTKWPLETVLIWLWKHPSPKLQLIEPLNMPLESDQELFCVV
jgi:hypothetical protein